MHKSIVVFYTWSGHTRQMAQMIATLTGADLLEIKPKIPYTQNYSAVVTQAQEEIRNGYLPPLEPIECDFKPYDVVYIGTPIWWGTIAPPIATFLNEHNFEGKTVLPFVTHGGGGKGHSNQDIEQLCTGATIGELYAAYEGGGSMAQQEITAWLQKAKI